MKVYKTSKNYAQLYGLVKDNYHIIGKCTSGLLEISLFKKEIFFNTKLNCIKIKNDMDTFINICINKKIKYIVPHEVEDV